MLGRTATKKREGYVLQIKPDENETKIVKNESSTYAAPSSPNPRETPPLGEGGVKYIRRSNSGASGAGNWFYHLFRNEKTVRSLGIIRTTGGEGVSRKGEEKNKLLLGHKRKGKRKVQGLNLGFVVRRAGRGKRGLRSTATKDGKGARGGIQKKKQQKKKGGTFGETRPVVGRK